tara:strand:- start:7117 stop:7824 length:708 start_codon:yes stop_codon:yes gene_type:complete
MPTSRISGNQIENTLEIVLTGLQFEEQDSELIIPKGTEGQRPETPAVGMIRFNTTEDKMEQYVNVARNSQPGWINVKGGGSGGGLGEYSIIKGNARTINESIEIPSNSESAYGFENCFTVGPEITIASGFSVTVGDGAKWTIVEDGTEPGTLDTSGPLGSKIGPQWTSIGSSDGLGDYQLIRGNPRTISNNLTVPYNPSNAEYEFEDSYSIGPIITIASGVTLTITSGASYEIID